MSSRPRSHGTTTEPKSPTRTSQISRQMSSQPRTRSHGTTTEPKSPTRTSRVRIKKKQRRQYHRLSRSDRSKIRILHSLGFTSTDICMEIGCTITPILRALRSETKQAADDNVDDDWDYIDDEFRERFCEPSSASTAARVNIVEEGSDAVNEACDVNVHRPLVPIRERGVSILASTAQCEGAVKRFLASLDHDLTFIYDSLKKQRLGDQKNLFLLAKFTDSDLHNIFKEALPEITVAERYILVKGLKSK